MLDQFGRDIRYLRVSVTDRCNLRCRYCMPEEGVEWVPHSAILSYEQIVHLVKVAAQLGVEKVRLTGGEPLVRKGLAGLVREIKHIHGIRTVCLTTNGLLLADQLPALLEAGLDGVNLSLDTLDKAQFAALTRRDGLAQAMAGLEAALAAPGLTVKVNCVPSGENDGQLVPLAALAKDRDLTVRFIELMPIGLGSSLTRRTEQEVLARLEKAFGPAIPCPQDTLSGPSRNVTFRGFQGKVGFISAMTHQFCSTCNRVRLTADGRVRPCLGDNGEVDIRTYLGDEAALLAAIRDAVYRKPQGHHFESGFSSSRDMQHIGG